MHVEIDDSSRPATTCSCTLHQRARGSGSGVEVEIESFNVYTFRDGKVTRIELFTDASRRSRPPD